MVIQMMEEVQRVWRLRGERHGRRGERDVVLKDLLQGAEIVR